MMKGITKEALQVLREQFPKGTRLELIEMDDPYNRRLVPGCRGTVTSVDSLGTIHVNWDCGSSLGIVYGVDRCRKVVETT